MTRPITKAQLSLMPVPINRRLREDSIIHFMTKVVLLGASIGIGIAALILLSDTFGLFTLISAESNPIAIAFSFIVSGGMISTPFSLAVSVGLSGKGRKDQLDSVNP